MAELKNHKGYWLRDDAAREFNRAEDDHGVFRVNSAGRTVPQQQTLINRWDKGGAANRPPYLFNPARPAETSNHVVDGGKAVDTPDYVRFAKICRNYGFVHTYPGGDPVHFDFVGGNLGRGGYADGSLELGLFQEKLIRLGHDLGKSGADKILGPKTKAATLHEQSVAEKNGYPGGVVVDDGIPGDRTNAYLDWVLGGKQVTPPAPPVAAPAPAPVTPHYPVVSISNIANIGDVRGLQKIANKNGAGTKIDNNWGVKSQKGFRAFLANNYQGSIVVWLTKRWGYKGNNQLGPVMIAALKRANAENYQVL